jgi:type IV pilus assembly protein PilF
MRNRLIFPFALLALSGCVTQTTYVGSEQPVVENQINNVEVARTRISLALQYLGSGNTTQAKFNLERALNMAPTLPEVHYTFAHYYQTVGENQLAKQAYMKALEIKPNDPNTLNNYGAFLCKIGDYAEANEQFLKAIAVPSYLRVAQSYENLALCSIKADNFDAAEQHLRSAINHNGQRQSTLLLLASLLYAKSDLHQATQVLKHFEDKGFVSPESLFIRYLVDIRMGRLEQAEVSRKTLLQTYASSVQAGWVLEDKVAQSDVEQLREQYRKAQLDALTQEGTERFVKQPEIKITRKSAPPVAAPAMAATASTAPVSTAPASTAPTDKPTPFIQYSEQKPTITPEKTRQPQVQFKDSVSQPSSRETVTFYKPDPTEVTFTTPESSPPRVELPVRVEQNAANLLNPEVLLPNIPVHELQIGENLFSVSVKYNIKMSKLLQWNELKESERLTIGSKIYLNNPRTTATIESGDSLLDVANRYQVMVDELMRWNKLTPDVALKPGYSLLVVDPTTYKL